MFITRKSRIRRKIRRKNQDRVQRALERERFVVPEVSSLTIYMTIETVQSNEMINQGFSRTEEANHEN